MKQDALRQEQRAYIRTVLDTMGLTPTELARRCDVSASTFTRFLNNKNHSANLSATTLNKVQAVSGIASPSQDQALPKVSTPNMLKVWGRVAAGVWREVRKFEADEYLGNVPVAPLPKFEGREQYALLVDGPSVNRKIKQGDYAICVTYGSMPNGYRDGQYVHVERHRAGLVEATIKKVKITDAGVQLWPDSDHPAHQEPMTLDHDDVDTTVVVRGVVIGSFSHWE